MLRKNFASLFARRASPLVDGAVVTMPTISGDDANFQTVPVSGSAPNADCANDLAARYQAARSLPTTSHREYAVLRDTLLGLLMDQPRLLDDKSGLGLQIIQEAAELCAQLGPTDQAIKLFRHLTRSRSNAKDHYWLSELLATTDLKCSFDALTRAVALDPAAYDTEVNRETLHAIQARLKIVGERRPRVHISRYPSDAEFRGSLSTLMSTHIAPGAKNEATFIDANTKFFTMDSCFARNIAQSLVRSGYNAHNLEISEHINTTFANRAFVDWLVGHDSDLGRRFQELVMPGWSAAHTLSLLCQANVIIFTLGVAAAFFDRDTGEFVLPRPSALNSRALAENFVWRMTTVPENVTNVKYLIEFVRARNPKAQIVLTVSPVPIQASFGLGPCVQTDCISKSTMRLVAHEIVSDATIRDVIYWPSFEAFRWAGSNSSQYFGVDDGASWHVAENKVAEVIEAFLSRFNAQPATSEGNRGIDQTSEGSSDRAR